MTTAAEAETPPMHSQGEQEHIGPSSGDARMDVNTAGTDIALEHRETSPYYSQLTTSCFKTLNRIVDDILVDLALVQGEHGGVLQRHPLEYSHSVSEIKYNKFEVRFLNETSPLVNTVEHRHSVCEGCKVTAIRGLLFSNSEPSLSRTQVYHLRIAIKSRANEKHVVKNEFHLTELSPEDAQDLIESSSVKDLDPQIVKDALPKLVDSASFVCSITKRALRIEISEPEFVSDDLHEFEIGPINVRHRKARETFHNIPENPPSPAQCLHTLFKALRGPLTLEPNEELKSIPAQNKSLNIHINPEILLKKLHFEKVKDEYFPPNISNREDRKSSIIRESYTRKITEIMLLGTKAYSQGGSNPFGHHQFVKTFDLVFAQFGDTASSIHHKQVLKDVHYINLSAYPFYSDDLIITCYKNTVESDPENAMLYVDSIKDISDRKANLKLSGFVKDLKTKGIIGKRDLDNAYKKLNIDPEHAQLMDDDILLTMYKNEVIAHPNDPKLSESMDLIANQRRSDSLLRYLKYEPMLLDRAYETLEIDSSVDDDVISTAFMIKKDDAPLQTQYYNRAYLTIAIARQSSALLNVCEGTFPELTEFFTFRDACSYLGADENANELQYITLFQINDSGDLLKSRSALRVIGIQKKSELIGTYLSTGMIDHKSLPAKDWPVGLDNIGNTCYLNSLLQYYFCIKPIRDRVLDFDDVFERGLAIFEKRRIGGRSVSDDEIERSFQFIYQLRDLFHNMIHTPKMCIAPTKELSYLAFLPSDTKVEFHKDRADDIDLVLIHDTGSEEGEVEDIQPDESDLIDLDNTSADDLVMVDGPSTLTQVDEPEDTPFEDAVEDNPVDEENTNEPLEIDGEPDAIEIRSAEMEGIELASPPSSSKVKAAKISESEIETAYDLGRQQDVTECIGNVLSQIEAALKPDSLGDNNEQMDFVKRLFYGSTVAHLVHPLDSSSTRQTSDKFSNLYANVGDHPRHLYDAIDNTFASEEVSVGGEQLQRTERIKALPPILQIQIQRVYFDLKLSRPYKDISPLPFPERLYMDRYFDTDDAEIIKRRKEVVEWKAELGRLKQRKEKLLKRNAQGFTYKESLRSMNQWLNDEELCDEDTKTTVEKVIAKIDEELSFIFERTLEVEKKIDHQFDAFQKHGYSIFAIFIHRGEASYGHYWIYIRDRERNMYRKYNDETVSEVTAAEVFSAEEGNTATPYFLAYVKDDEQDIVDPLCRSVDA